MKEVEEGMEIVDIERGKGKRSGLESDGSGPQNIGWGRWYSLKELEIATRGFSPDNVIGEGGYGVVFRGIFQDGSVVAVKNLLNNKYVSFFSISNLAHFCFFFFHRNIFGPKIHRNG